MRADSNRALLSVFDIKWAGDMQRFGSEKMSPKVRGIKGFTKYEV